MEGSLLILPAAGLLALAAFLCGSRHRKLAYSAFGLTAVGVGLLLGLSALGGVGGHTGRSMLWLLVVVPYPIGALMAVVVGLRIVSECSQR